MKKTPLTATVLPITLFLLFVGIGCSPVIKLDDEDRIGAPLPDEIRAGTAAATSSTRSNSPERTSPKTSTPTPTTTQRPRAIPAPKPPPSRRATKRWYENVQLGPIELDARGTPNWNDRYDQYYAAYRKAFRLPKLKESMKVELGDGRMRDLIFEGVSGDIATFSLPGKGELGVQKDNLGTITRARLFRDDAATYTTNRKIRYEKNMLESGKVTELPPRRASSQTAGGPRTPYKPYQPTGGSSGSFRTPKVGTTGETPQVTRFINDHIRDPQIIKWYPVQRDPRGEGYTQDVLIKAYGGKTLGYFQERKRIFMRDNGSVYRQMNIK